MNNILEIKHLKKYYGNSRGVEDVSLLNFITNTVFCFYFHAL